MDDTDPDDGSSPAREAVPVDRWHHTMMRSRLPLLVLTALTLPLVACTPSPDTSSSEPSSSEGVGYDAASACAGFSDVLTVVANGKAGLDTGRMEEQERDGWFQLATSMLERLPTVSDHPVADALDRLQTVAPHDPGWYESTTIDTAEWHEAALEASRACDEAGQVAPTRMFSGG